MASSSKVSRECVYYFLNGRPVDLPKKISGVFTDFYKQYNASVHPVIVLNFDVEDKNYDINVSPDKREVFIKNETEVYAGLKEVLGRFFECVQTKKVLESAYVPGSRDVPFGKRENKARLWERRNSGKYSGKKGGGGGGAPKNFN